MVSFIRYYSSATLAMASDLEFPNASQAPIVERINSKKDGSSGLVCFWIVASYFEISS